MKVALLVNYLGLRDDRYFFKHLATMPILAVLRGITPSEVVTVGETLVQARITLLEVTMDSLIKHRPPNCTSILHRIFLLLALS